MFNLRAKGTRRNAHWHQQLTQVLHIVNILEKKKFWLNAWLSVVQKHKSNQQCHKTQQTRIVGLLLDSSGKTLCPHAMVVLEPSGARASSWAFTGMLPPNPAMGISAALDSTDLSFLPVK